MQTPMQAPSRQRKGEQDCSPGARQVPRPSQVRAVFTRSPEQDGAPHELYQAPATIFAARFIGTPPMNVVPAKVAAGIPRLAAAAPPGRSLEALALGVRPEDVRIAPDGLDARVVAAEYLGADTLIETRLGEGPFMIKVAGRLEIPQETGVRIGWEPAATQRPPAEGILSSIQPILLRLPSTSARPLPDFRITLRITAWPLVSA